MATLSFWHHHGGVSVPDLEASIAWYRDVLGFQVESKVTIEAIPAEMAMLRNGELRVELFEVEGARPASEIRSEPNEDLRTYGNKHICFGIHDIDEFGEELKSRGADIVWIKRFAFGANIFLRDNAGNLIEFIESSPPAGTLSTL
ncbi:VOC family protein [Caballeronia sp. DA-9]|uniref:VOC family protein n=1 Tax=Caballeronia sp. DA-9 TaxID=3436237 RepID=UPI003F663F51